jgi:Cation transport ATPase (P-type)
MRTKIEKRLEKLNMEIIGDASETALLRFCDNFKDSDLMRFKFEKIFEIPFNSKVN